MAYWRGVADVMRDTPWMQTISVGSPPHHSLLLACARCCMVTAVLLPYFPQLHAAMRTVHSRVTFFVQRWFHGGWWFGQLVTTKPSITIVHTRTHAVLPYRNFLPGQTTVPYFYPDFAHLYSTILDYGSLPLPTPVRFRWLVGGVRGSWVCLVVFIALLPPYLPPHLPPHTHTPTPTTTTHPLPPVFTWLPSPFW